MLHQPLVLPILLITIFLSGCSTMDSMRSFIDSRLRAQPAEGTGFVPMEELAKDPRLPSIRPGSSRGWIGSATALFILPR